jgi:hypothetical protein
MAQERLAQLLQVLAGMQSENPPLPPSPFPGMMGEPAPPSIPTYGLPTGSRQILRERPTRTLGTRFQHVPATGPTFSPELEAANARLGQSGTEITPQFLAMQTRGPLDNYMETIRQLDEASAPARMEIADLEAKKLEIEEQIKEAKRLMQVQQKEGTVQLKGSPGMGLGR